MLRDEIVRLQRSSRRLIWLNPVLGAPEYEPLTRGIQGALPFIDDFMPVVLKTLLRRLRLCHDLNLEAKAPKAS